MCYIELGNVSVWHSRQKIRWNERRTETKMTLVLCLGKQSIPGVITKKGIKPLFKRSFKKMKDKNKPNICIPFVLMPFSNSHYLWSVAVLIVAARLIGPSFNEQYNSGHICAELFPFCFLFFLSFVAWFPGNENTSCLIRNLEAHLLDWFTLQF